MYWFCALHCTVTVHKRCYFSVQSKHHHLKSKAEREEWERVFSETYIQPVIQVEYPVIEESHGPSIDIMH